MNIKKPQYDEFGGLIVEDTEPQYDEFGGIIEPEEVPTTPPPTATPEKPLGPTRGREDYGLYGKIFPRSSHADYEGAGTGKKTLAALGDVLSVPARAISAGATWMGAKSEGMPNAEAAKLAGEDFGQFKSEEGRAPESGIGGKVLGLAQDASYDPVNVIPGAAVVKTVGKIGQGGLAIKKAIDAKKALGAVTTGSASGAASAAIDQSTQKDVDWAQTAVATALGAATPLVLNGVGTGLRKTIGAASEKIGQAFQPGDLKIQKSTAKLSYGPTINAKKEHLQKVIVDHGLTKGSYGDESIRAVDMANQRFSKVEEIVSSLANDPKAKKVNPYDVAFNGIDPVALAGKDTKKRLKYEGIVESIKSAFAADGVPTSANIAELIKIKRELDPEGIIFKRGLDLQGIDPAEIQVKKRIYYNLVNAIGDISPETKELNRQAKDLLDASTVLDQAASRIKNKDAISLTEKIGGAAAAVASLSNPGSLWVTAPAMLATSMSKGGRLSNALISQGRKLQGKEDVSIEGTLENVRKANDPFGKERGTWVALPENVTAPAVERKHLGYIDRVIESENARLRSIGEEIGQKREAARTTREIGEVATAKKIGEEAKRKQLQFEINAENRVLDLEKRAKTPPGTIAHYRKLGDEAEAQEILGIEQSALAKAARKKELQRQIDEENATLKKKGFFGNQRGSVGVGDVPEIPTKWKDAYNLGQELKNKGIDLTEAIHGMHGKELENRLESIFFDDAKSIFFDLGHKNKELPEYVVGERYGELPEGGRSVNFREQKYEKGVSLMNLVGEEPSEGAKIYEMFNRGGRKKEKYGGWLIGTGSDGEPLILGAKKYDPTNPDITAKAPVKIMGGLAAGSAGALTAYGAAKAKMKRDKEKRGAK